MTSPRILIVDDEPSILNLLRDVVLMSCEEAQVEIAGSVREAFEFICRNEYDVVLSDIQMEGMSGIDLVRETRCLRPVPPTIVLMTGDQTLLSSAFESGAYTCLRKPLPWDVLTDVLKRAVEFNRLQREVERFRQVREFMSEQNGELWDGLQKQTQVSQAQLVHMREQEWREVGPIMQTRAPRQETAFFQDAGLDRGAA